MGMALDEPGNEDKKYSQDNLNFTIDPFLYQMIQTYGSLLIDYRKSRFFGNSFDIRLGNSHAC